MSFTQRYQWYCYYRHPVSIFHFTLQNASRSAMFLGTYGNIQFSGLRPNPERIRRIQFAASIGTAGFCPVTVPIAQAYA
jgi:hypothetical protein